MPNQLLIGILSGVAAALMLYSSTIGASPIAFLLSLTSIAPIFLAGLGWGLHSAVIAASVGAGILALLASPASGAIWMLTQAGPALLLIRYAFLNREVTQAPPQQSAQEMAKRPISDRMVPSRPTSDHRRSHCRYTRLANDGVYWQFQ